MPVLSWRNIPARAPAHGHPPPHHPCLSHLSERSCPPAVPLAVWPVAQTTAQQQRAGRHYDRGCTAHPAKMLPDLARRIIDTYSNPGDLVVDPMCGIGTTIIEAAGAGRRAVGLELEARWADLARANSTRRSPLPRPGWPRSDIGDATRRPHPLGDLFGKVDLVCTSPPYGCDAGVIDKPAWLAGGRLCPATTLNYSTDRTNVGHHRGDRYAESMAAIYAGCYQLLRPGGLLVTVTKNTRRAGRTLDLAGRTVAIVTQAGFAYQQHIVALHAAVRDAPWRPGPVSGSSPRPATPVPAASPPISWSTRTSKSSNAHPENEGGLRMALDLPLSVWATAQQTARSQRAGRYLELSGPPPGQDAPRHRRPSHRRLHPTRRPGRRPDVRDRHHPRRGRPPAETPSASNTNRTGPTWPGPTSRPPADPGARARPGHLRRRPPCRQPHRPRRPGPRRPRRHLPALRAVIARPSPGPARPRRGQEPQPVLRPTPPTWPTSATSGSSKPPARSWPTWAACSRPGGIIAMTVRPYRHAGALVDLPGEIAALAGSAGLVLFERNVALLAGLRDDHLVPRSSFFALEQARKARLRGETRLVIAHEDLLIFRKLGFTTPKPSARP